MTRSARQPPDVPSIMVRSKMVTKELRKQYRYLTSDQRPLAVFCVSNKVYEQYRIGYEKSEQPVLALEHTYIPALRCHLRMATAEGRFNDALFHYEKQLPSLLTSFDLWCCKTHMKRKRELEEMVLEPKEVCRTIIRTLFDEIRVFVETQILVLIKQREQVWTKKATELCLKWKTENNNGTYMNLLRRSGFRKATKAKPEVSWNRDLVEIMTPALGPVCIKLLSLLIEIEQRIAFDLEEPLSQLKQKIFTDPQSTLMALSPFLVKVEQEKPAMRLAVETNFRLLRRNMKTMTLDLTTESESSILGTCMQDVYELARSISGSGSGIKRPAKVQDCIVGSGALWMKVHKVARERFDAALSIREARFENAVMGILEHIHASFTSCCQDKEVEEPAEKALRERLQKNMDKVRKIYDGVLSEAMADCKQNQA